MCRRTDRRARCYHCKCICVCACLIFWSLIIPSSVMIVMLLSTHTHTQHTHTHNTHTPLAHTHTNSKKWLRYTGSPKSVISKCVFDHESHNVSTMKYKSFQVVWWKHVCVCVCIYLLSLCGNGVYHIIINLHLIRTLWRIQMPSRSKPHTHTKCTHTQNANAMQSILLCIKHEVRNRVVCVCPLRVLLVLTYATHTYPQDINCLLID